MEKGTKLKLFLVSISHSIFLRYCGTAKKKDFENKHTCNSKTRIRSVDAES